MQFLERDTERSAAAGEASRWCQREELTKTARVALEEARQSCHYLGRPPDAVFLSVSRSKINSRQGGAMVLKQGDESFRASAGVQLPLQELSYSASVPLCQNVGSTWPVYREGETDVF